LQVQVVGWFDNFFPGGDMIRTHSNDHAAQPPVLHTSQARQEKICKEVYDYLTRVKTQKLKEAILEFNTIIKQMLK